MKTIGTCPKCGKGQLIEGTNGYSCNHFKSLEDKCDFILWNKYFGKEITEELAIELATNHETEVFDDLVTKEGKIFKAKLIFKDGFIAPDFVQEHLDIDCPVCNGSITKTAKAFVCENYFKEDCSVYINNEIAGVQLSEEIAKTILSGNKTALINGFIKRDGTEFSARLFLDMDDHKVKFDGSICTCPKCKTGTIHMYDKSYGCSNYKNEAIKCDFGIWREISGKVINAANVVLLCDSRITGVIKGFRKKGGELYEGKLTLSEDFKVKIV